MKFSLTLFGMLLAVSVATAQQPILKLSDKNTYELFFVNVQLFSEGYLQTDTLKNKTVVEWDTHNSFFVRDFAVIEALKNQWLGVAGNKSGCLHDYDLYVFEKDRLQDFIEINETCQQAATRDKILNYSISPVSLIDSSKNIAVARLIFPTPEQGREFIAYALQTEGVLLSSFENYEWYKFDEDLLIETQIGNKKNRESKIVKHLSEKFPQEVFKVEYVMEDVFRITCTKNMAYKTGFKAIHRNIYDNVRLTIFSYSVQPLKLALKNWEKSNKIDFKKLLPSKNR